MSTAEGKRLPNELLAEIASTMPAGILSIVRERGDFMERMKPLSAFVLPRIRKFHNKGKECFNRMELEEKKICAKLYELTQAIEQLLSPHIQDNNDDQELELPVDEFFRLRGQKISVIKEYDELKDKFTAFNSAWNRSFKFAKELAGEDNKAADNNSDGDSTVCEASKKRKKPCGNGEEGVEEEETKSKRAKTD